MIANVVTPPVGAYGTDQPGAAATVVAPGATTSIASIAVIAKEKPAMYRARVRYGYTAGAPAAAEVNNWRLVYQAVVLMAPLACSAVLAGSVLNVFEFLFSDAGLSGTLAIQSVGAGTAGVSYTADMELTRLS